MEWEETEETRKAVEKLQNLSLLVTMKVPYATSELKRPNDPK